MTAPNRITNFDTALAGKLYGLAVTEQELNWVLDNCPQAKYMINIGGRGGDLFYFKYIVYTASECEVARFALRWGISLEKTHVYRTYCNG